ncbi:MAG: tannase/feruloyl esterase family alpha/beta hydrolase [Acidobacteria bacterium]|nr:tannase/feruloyl esterase family alpha/beta hydrolase [Acidobacteriota bacterium]
MSNNSYRVLAFSLVFASASLAQRAESCAAMKRFSAPGLALEITKTEWKAAVDSGPIRLPAHCRVDGILDRRTGVAGKPYGIQFAVALPDEWNGSFLMQGGGGLNGTVSPPVGPVAAGGRPALSRGFAVASTDTGHQGRVFDGSFLADQQAALDFAYVAIGRVAQLAKQIVVSYYSKPANHSYFTGCSTGGREAMIMTQRYPSYFDGVISGAPAMRTGYSNLADRWMVTMLNRVAPKDPEGKPQAAKALTAGEKKTIMDALLEACDANDGLRDGAIWNPRDCRFDVKTLVCKAAKSDSCLTAEQAAAIEQGLAGPRTSRGAAVYSPFPWDTGLTAGGQGAIPGLLNPGPSPVGPPQTATEMDVDAAAAGIAGDPQVRLTDSTWINLSSFSAHGGKLLFFHGMSDPWFSALDTLDYYQRMTKSNGGLETVSPWSRIFLVPSMGHCGGGEGAMDNFDLLSAMVAWVERNQAPESVVATSRSKPGRSRPLCAYPKHAHYAGNGDPEKAENFVCRE